MSIHWGLRHVPKTICTYQSPVAHAAIDGGADLILGHHAHSIKAVEVYKGKVCFYSIGNFMTTGRAQRSIGSYRKWNVVRALVEKSLALGVDQDAVVVTLLAETVADIDVALRRRVQIPAHRAPRDGPTKRRAAAAQGRPGRTGLCRSNRFEFAPGLRHQSGHARSTHIHVAIEHAALAVCRT